MKTQAVLFIVLAFGLCWPAAALAEERFQEGVHYSELAAPPTLVNAADGRLEVGLFVWYGCGACALVDPLFTEWAAALPKNVAVYKRPVTYAEPWNMHARIFMTLEEMGREKEFHQKISETFASREGMVRSEADFEAFANTLGLDPKVFAATYHSAAVDKRLEDLNALLKAYDPPVVPSIVVDGRYLTDLGRVESPAELMELTEFLMKKARAVRDGQ